jgi:F-type H+-transporting ATPase subunit epsilon
MASHGGADPSYQSARVMDCVIVTPEATVREASAQFVAVPLFDGELGIAPRHSPMIGRLGFGEMRIVEGGVTERYYVDGGFVQVADNVVTVLTPRAIRAADLSETKAAELLEQARSRPANSPELIASRDRAQLQARAQLRIARKGSGRPSGH